MSKHRSEVSILKARFGDSSSVITHLFVKEDRGSAEKEAVQVLGLPVLHQGLSEALRSLFARVGEVESVTLDDQQASALLVFTREGATEKLLRIAAKGTVIDVDVPKCTAPHGLKGWLIEHKAEFPGNDVLRAQLDDWIEAFEARDAAEKAAAAKADDGWTVVTRRPGRRKTTDTESAIAVGGVSKAFAEAQAAKKPVKQLLNFYTHQKKAKRDADLLNLRAKFEEDKRRLAEMRAARRFKPY